MEILKGWTNEAAVAILHGAAVLEEGRCITVKTSSKKLGTVIVQKIPRPETEAPIFLLTAGLLSDKLDAEHITGRTAAEHLISLVGPKQAAKAIEKAAKSGLFATEAVIAVHAAGGTRVELSKTTAFSKTNRRTWGFIYRMYAADGRCNGADNISCLNPSLEGVLTEWETRVARRIQREEAGIAQI